MRPFIAATSQEQAALRAAPNKYTQIIAICSPSGYRTVGAAEDIAAACKPSAIPYLARNWWSAELVTSFQAEMDCALEWLI